MAVEHPANSGMVTSTESSLLSRRECTLMRGLSIFLIVIENFVHLLRGVYRDNEFNYLWFSVSGTIDNVLHPDPLTPYNLFTFFCPYGVMLFIFLSGYGLTMKYEKGDAPDSSSIGFIARHYKKLFFMQLKGLALFLALIVLFCHEKIDVYAVLMQTFLVGNLNPNLYCLPGPYWFFGMLLEMYVIYRLVIYRRRDGFAIALTVLSLLVMAFTDPEGNLLRNLRYNCFIAILPFCMGVLAARHLNGRSLLLDKPATCLTWFAASFILLTLCKFNFYSWLLLPVFVVANGVALLKLISRAKLLDRIFGWLGALSCVLFVVHPTVRQVLLLRANESGAYALTLLIYLLVTIALSFALKPLFSWRKHDKPESPNCQPGLGKR